VEASIEAEQRELDRKIKELEDERQRVLAMAAATDADASKKAEANRKRGQQDEARQAETMQRAVEANRVAATDMERVGILQLPSHHGPVPDLRARGRRPNAVSKCCEMLPHREGSSALWLKHASRSPAWRRRFAWHSPTRRML
jgi:hypothetical protein